MTSPSPIPPGTMPAGVQRRRLRVTGTVQGVGFRPFVYRHAVRLGLSGEVGNDAAGVHVEVEGSPAALDELEDLVRHHPPPLARVQSVAAETLPVIGRRGFEVVASTRSEAVEVPIPVDVGPCSACLAQLHDPDDRRHRYPFINCTDCGPRYTITRAVPYDRPQTTMASFTMCMPCRAEYEDPGDRRFHAQPNACADCGPRLVLTTAQGEVLADAEQALQQAEALLRGGGLLAVKGVGGFHLATVADDADAVAELRRRKARDDKPFALLVADVAAATRLVGLDPEAAAELAGPRRPIILAPRRDDAAVADGVAPGLDELGVMLPPSPLHDLLARDLGRPLVLTSGNLSDEPIAYEDADAHERLGPLVDAVLGHDRAIHVRCDDSVVRAGIRGGLQPLRRSRGHAPEPLHLPAGSHRSVLAVGAELKSTVAVTRAGTAVLSHHLGDLEHAATHRAFLEAIDHLLRVHEIAPEVVAHDLHPEYLSTKLAVDLDLPQVAVQHHHAHIASCLAEHGETGPVLGLALDGLGWGTDDTAWGGEVLACDLDGFDRLAHLAPVALPGGAAAVREPWRMAVSWVAHAFDDEQAREVAAGLDERWPAVLEVVGSSRALATTSAGRLFDAVAALLGLRSRVTFEGQAAIELEARARRVPVSCLPPVEATGIEVHRAPGGAPWVLDPAGLIREVVRRRDGGEGVAEAAAWFHTALAAALVDVSLRLARERGLDAVALSGGVYQNRRLTDLVADGLERGGLRVLVHRRVPPNDGGISLGQAAIAAR